LAGPCPSGWIRGWGATLILVITQQIVGESDGVSGAGITLTVTQLLVAQSNAVTTASATLGAFAGLLTGESDAVTTATISVTVAQLALIAESDASATATLALAIVHALIGESASVAVALMMLTTGVLPPPPGVWHGAAILATAQPFASRGATAVGAALIGVTSNSQPAIGSLVRQ